MTEPRVKRRAILPRPIDSAAAGIGLLMLGSVWNVGCAHKDADLPMASATAGPAAAAGAAGKDLDAFLDTLESMPANQRQAYMGSHEDIVQRITTGSGNTARMNRLVKLVASKP